MRIVSSPPGFYEPVKLLGTLESAPEGLCSSRRCVGTPSVFKPISPDSAFFWEFCKSFASFPNLLVIYLGSVLQLSEPIFLGCDCLFESTKCTAEFVYSGISGLLRSVILRETLVPSVRPAWEDCPWLAPPYDYLCPLIFDPIWLSDEFFRLPSDKRFWFSLLAVLGDMLT